MDLLISQDEIAEKIQSVAQKIDEQYKDKSLLIVMVMKGAICVTTDIIRKLQIPFTIDYLKASSYGQNGAVSGELKIIGLDELDVTDKDVLLIDDIFDTGKTLTVIVEKIQKKKPKSLKTLVLLLKKVPRQMKYRPDYVLFEIEDRFVVGYGLDYKEHYRGLPAVFAFINDTPPN